MRSSSAQLPVLMALLVLLSASSAVAQQPPPSAPPPPGYGAPAWPAPPAWYAPPTWSGPYEPREPPKTLPFRDGAPPPPGYVLEQGPHRGLVIAGSVTFGSLYGLSLLGSLSGGSDTGWLAVPIAGPVIYAGKTECSESDIYEDRDCGDDIADVFLTIDALGQAAGAVLFTIGITRDRKRWVRADRAANEGVSVAFAPSVSVRGGYGLSALGSF